MSDKKNSPLFRRGFEALCPSITVNASPVCPTEAVTLSSFVLSVLSLEVVINTELLATALKVLQSIFGHVRPQEPRCSVSKVMIDRETSRQRAHGIDCTDFMQTTILSSTRRDASLVRTA